MKSVFQLYLTEPQLKARDPGAIYLRRFQHAMDDHGHAAHRPFLSHTQTGMFGLAGFAGMLAAARAGKWADQGWAQRTTGLALALLTISWLPIGYAETSLLWLIAGVIALDFAVQAVHVSSQSLIIAAEACSGKPHRLGLTCVFIRWAARQGLSLPHSFIPTGDGRRSALRAPRSARVHF